MDELLTVGEVAEFLKLHKIAIYKLCYRRQIPYIIVGKRTKRFDKKAIEKWLDKNTVNDKMTIGK